MACNIQTGVVQFKFKKSNTSELLQAPQFSTKNNPKKKKNFDLEEILPSFLFPS
jgi:hypothetical protein